MTKLTLAAVYAAMILLVLMVVPAKADGWYAGVYGGANFDDVIEASGVDNKSGVLIGGVVGKGVKAVPGLRVEADISFRQNEVTFDPCGPCAAVTIDHDTWALMANAAYDVDLGMVKPYALVGVGYANTQGTLENIALARVESAGVAWQLGTGVNVDVADGVTVGAGYRYFNGPDVTVLGTELASGGNHSVLASASFALD